VQLSIDDFGTGYSSMQALLSMPFSELKLDRGFVQSCDSDPYAWKIVRATLSLAREFGMTCVAEGVESETVCAMLTEAGCEYGQGYLFSEPRKGGRYRSRPLRADPRYRHVEAGATESGYVFPARGGVRAHGRAPRTEVRRGFCRYCRANRVRACAERRRCSSQASPATVFQP
jgi:hypothetical protein